MSRRHIINTFRLFSKEWRSLIAPFWMDFCAGLFFIGLPALLVARYEADEPDLALLTGIGLGLYVLVAPVVGRLGDAGWRSRLMIIAPVFVLLSLVCIILSTRLWHNYFAIVMFFVGMSMFWPALIGTLSQTDRPARAIRRLTVLGLARVTAYSSGLMVGGELSEIDLAIPLLVCGMMVVALVPLSFVISPKRDEPENARHAEPQELVLPNVVRQNFFCWMARIANFTVAGSISAVQRLYVRTGERIDLDVSDVGMLLMILGVGQMIGFACLGMFPNFWFCRVMPLVAAQVLFTVSFMMLGCLSDYAMLSFVMILAGLSVSLTRMSSLSYGVTGAQHAGLRSGLDESIRCAGEMFIPLVAGLSIWLWNGEAIHGAPYLTAAVLIVPTAFIELLLYMKMRRRENELAYSETARSGLQKQRTSPGV